MTISKDKVVSIEYSLKNDAGELLDSSEGTGPLEYIQGHNNIIPGLEKALEGKTAGDKISVVVAPADGYGEHHDDLVIEVDKSQFQADGEIEEGMQFEAESENGSHIVVVTKVTDSKVTVDANHPLAGENLHFDVTVADVRDATEQELEEGLDYGCGCEGDCDSDECGSGGCGTGGCSCGH